MDQERSFGQFYFKQNGLFSEKESMRFHFAFVLLSIFSLSASAQVDASSQMLLKMSKSTSKNQNTEAGLESGRYKVKAGVANTLPKKEISSVPVDSTAKALDKAVFAKEEKPAEVKKAELSTTTTTTLSVTEEIKESQAVISEAPTTTVPAVVEPPVTTQVADLVTGQSQPFVEAYREQIHPDDVRLNVIEITILPGLVYNDSKSNYYFRNYQSFASQYDLKAEFWMTPLIGFYADYKSSMAADVAGASGSRIAAKHEGTEIGMDFRKFFGLSRKSNSFEFGFHVFDYKFTVPSDETTRAKIKSSGLAMHIKGRFPTTPTYAWVIGGMLAPRVSHAEQATGIDLNSGSGVDSIRMGANVGGEFKMVRQNQIIWNLSYVLEKNQFSGTANTTDPERGTIPSGVSVNNTFIIFSFGYRWGQ